MSHIQIADNDQHEQTPSEDEAMVESLYESNVYQGDWTLDPDYVAAIEAQGVHVMTHEEVQAIIEATQNADHSRFEGVGIH